MPEPKVEKAVTVPVMSVAVPEPNFVFGMLADDRDLFDHVAQRAKRERRTLEGQIVWMLFENFQVAAGASTTPLHGR